MLRIRSYLTVLMATCLLLVGGPALGIAPQGRANNLDEWEKKTRAPWSQFFEGAECGTRNGLKCLKIDDTKKWAEAVTEWKYPGGNGTDGTRANAFKHCIWMGATATRFGEQEAERIGEAHEGHNTFQRNSLRKMDEANNALGANIGAIAVYNRPDDQWGFVIETCKRYADANELYGLNGVPGKCTDREK